MRTLLIVTVIIIVILITTGIYMSTIKAKTTDDIKDKDIIADVPVKKGDKTKITLADTLPNIKYNKSDIILAKNNTSVYTVPPRNASEREKFRMSSHKKGANIGWYYSDHGMEDGIFYSKVTINLGGVYKEFYMPKRDIKIKTY